MRLSVGQCSIRAAIACKVEVSCSALQLSSPEYQFGNSVVNSKVRAEEALTKLHRGVSEA
jgi:hypothetical protein